jgi:hypothetical protein
MSNNNYNAMMELYQSEIAETNKKFPVRKELQQIHPSFTIVIGQDGMETRDSFENNKRICLDYHSEQVKLFLTNTNKGE